jgi:hypothetical protein
VLSAASGNFIAVEATPYLNSRTTVPTKRRLHKRGDRKRSVARSTIAELAFKISWSRQIELENKLEREKIKKDRRSKKSREKR